LSRHPAEIVTITGRKRRFSNGRAIWRSCVGRRAV